ncbi:hypothetical protein KIL84_013369 [Mauremys mutica]|uniref:Uncharacterized protein n=1 Tax=Mauremys mutica TaxID=74926 RepID=A0A9D4ASC1_9SAUR|nr:hypothetical protein KIL84_013369 [Mauremys mutica]
MRQLISVVPESTPVSTRELKDAFYHQYQINLLCGVLGSGLRGTRYQLFSYASEVRTVQYLKNTDLVIGISSILLVMLGEHFNKGLLNSFPFMTDGFSTPVSRLPP